MAFTPSNHPKPEAGYPAMETLLLNLERFDPELRHFTVHVYTQNDVPAGNTSPTEDIRDPQPGGGPWASQLHRVFDYANRVNLTSLLYELYEDNMIELRPTRFLVLIVFDPSAGPDRSAAGPKLFSRAPASPSVAMVLCHRETLYKYAPPFAQKYYEALPIVHQQEHVVEAVEFDRLCPYYAMPRWTLDRVAENPGHCNRFADTAATWERVILNPGFALPANPNRVFGPQELTQLRNLVFREYLNWFMTSNDRLCLFGALAPVLARRSARYQRMRYPTLRDWMNHAFSGDISVLPAPPPRSTFATAFAHLRPAGSAPGVCGHLHQPNGSVTPLTDALAQVPTYRARAHFLMNPGEAIANGQQPIIVEQAHPDEDYFAGMDNPDPDPLPIPLPNSLSTSFGLYPYFPRIAELAIRFLGEFFLTRAPGAASDWEIVVALDRLINDQHFLAGVLAKIGDYETQSVILLLNQDNRSNPKHG